jgi:hypothetical protein
MWVWHHCWDGTTRRCGSLEYIFEKKVKNIVPWMERTSLLLLLLLLLSALIIVVICG